ncbi:MAG: hypothetical protein JWP87_3708 [Labilithrix sp.]|nr:hypothetical protein [Labilithrix sp.]
MRRITRTPLRTPARTLAAFGAVLALAVSASACGSSEDPNTVGGPNDPSNPNNPSNPNDPNAPPAQQTPEEQVKQILDARKADYGEALRTASLKLRDELPSLAEIKQIEAAADDAAKKVVYEKLVDDMIASPKFAAIMVKFWKDTFRTGQVGALQMGAANRDTAANFAAQIVVDSRAYSELLTASTNTCPTFDPATSTFTPASCAVGATAGPTAGVLTDPGILSQYFANMAFRRVRFIQETFACSKFPAEYSATPKPLGNGTFTGAFPYESITGKVNTPNAKIDFQDTSAVICANCHVNLNRVAPMFTNYDAKGFLTAASQVEVPVPGNPKAQRIDYLPAAEGYAWRAGKPVTDIPTLGAAIAADPEVGRCAVNRMWNYAMSRGDIVNDLATIPNAVTEPYVKDFAANGQKLKETIRGIFKSEDFVKF